MFQQPDPQSLPTTRPMAQVARERIEELKKRVADPTRYCPVPTPLKKLNVILNGGFPRVDASYNVILGEDKIGKSTLLKHLFWFHYEIVGRPAILYDLEESVWQTVDRALARRSATFSRTDIYTLNLTEQDFSVMETIADDIERDGEIYINDTEFVLKNMYADALARNIYDIGVDNYQLIIGGSGSNTREQLENNSKYITWMRSQGFTTWLACQGNENDKVFASTQPFRDANWVIGMDNVYEIMPGKKKKGKPLPGLKHIDVRRARQTGTGDFDAVFEAPYSRLRDAEDDAKVTTNDDFVEFDEQPALFDDDEEIINGNEQD